MSVLAKPVALYAAQPVGPLAQVREDMGNAAVVVLKVSTGMAAMQIQSTVGSLSSPDWEDLTYSLTLGGPKVTSSLIDLEAGDHLYIEGPISFLQFNGLVTDGPFTLYYLGSPHSAPAEVTVSLGAELDALLAQLQQDTPQNVMLQYDMEDVGPLHPLPVTLPDLQEMTNAAGENHIGQVGGYGSKVRVDITRPANTTAYTANDVISSDNAASGAAALVIKNAVRRPGGSCLLQSITVVGDQAGGGGAETWQPRVWIYQNQRQTLLADNAAFTMSMLIYRQVVLQAEELLPALTSPAGSTIDSSKLENISIMLTAAPGSMDLYFDLQTLNAFSPSSGEQYSVTFGLMPL